MVREVSMVMTFGGGIAGKGGIRPGSCLRPTGSKHTWKAWGLHAADFTELKSSVLLLPWVREHQKVLTQMTASEASRQALHTTRSRAQQAHHIGSCQAGNSRDGVEQVNPWQVLTHDRCRERNLWVTHLILHPLSPLLPMSAFSILPSLHPQRPSHPPPSSFFGPCLRFRPQPLTLETAGGPSMCSSLSPSVQFPQCFQEEPLPHWLSSKIYTQ